MKNIYYLISAFLVFSFWGCNDSESDLLEPKIYFEQDQVNVEVEDIDNYQLEFSSRLTNAVDENVTLKYEIGDEKMVDEYNQKHGTKYLFMPKENFSLETPSSIIEAGHIYSQINKLALNHLAEVKEGNSYLVLIKITKSDLSKVPCSDNLYIVIKKPIVINKVYDFNGNYLSIPMPSTANLQSVTYEALIYGEYFSWISTIMGVEGILMLRSGEIVIKANQMQISGGVQFNASLEFATKKWYHVAFTFDGQSKQAKLFINGEKVADKTVDVESFNLTKNFFIGYAYDYDSRRTWHGKMSEVRVWNVARSTNEIRNNMLGVDPNSEGLFGYWKLNGSDYYEEEGTYYVKDQTKNGIDAVSRNGSYSGGSGRTVEPRVVDLKVNLK